MSTPTSTPGTPDDPAEHRDQPIDPTRTFDAYFEKQSPPVPAESETTEPDYTEADFTEDSSAERDATEPETAAPETGGLDLTKPGQPGSADAEPAYADFSYTDRNIEHPYSSSSYPDPADAEPASIAAAHPGPARTALLPESEIDEPVAPADFSAPAYTPPAASTTYTPAATVQDEEPAQRAVRMRTVVFGLVLLVIAGAVLVGQLTDVTVDAGAVLLALMIGGGLLLIAGARRS